MGQSIFETLERRRLLASVTNVFVNGAAWTTSFRNFLVSSGDGDATYGYRLDAADHADELPWTNLNQISIRFDEDVAVAAEDLIVRGVTTATYATGGFAYDSATFTATWTLPTGIFFGADKLLLDLDSGLDGVKNLAGEQLDGEWTNPTPPAAGGADVFPSGNGTAGGDFRFRMNVLPGDVDHDGTVLESSDVTLVRNSQNAPPGSPMYTIFKDVNGSGSILGSDVTLVRNRLGTVLPAGEPIPPQPTAAVSGAGTVDEGSTYTLALTTSDPADTAGWLIDWGDGSDPDEDGIVGENLAGNPLLAIHTYANGDTSREILARAFVDGTQADAAPVSVAVENVAPIINLGAGGQIDEGSLFAPYVPITDAGVNDQLSATIDWGDGALLEVIGGFATGSGIAPLEHVFADDGSYVVTLTVADGDGGTDLHQFTVDVANVAPTLDLYGTAPVDEGSTFAIHSNVGDTGYDDVLTATIDWGDRTPVETPSIDGGDLTLEHTYADDGTYTATMTVTDGDGGTAVETFDVLVNNVAPTLVASGTGSIKPGDTYTLDLSSSDPGDDTIHSWSIDWGDGTVEPLTGNPATATHAFGSAGTYLVSATATDEDGQHLANSVLLSVNAPGALDTTFNLNGTLIQGTGPYTARTVHVQPDGKIVVAGTKARSSPPVSGWDAWLSRYNSDGSLDTSFGTAGHATVSIETTANFFDFAFQGDGKIVAAGTVTGATTQGHDVLVARFNADGSLDSSFGTGGFTVVDLSGQHDHVRSLAIQSDGKIVVAGTVEGQNPIKFGVARFTTSGTLDGSFGSGGKVLTDIVGTDTTWPVVMVSADDKLLVAEGGANANIARYHANGALDVSFGSGGLATVSTGINSTNARMTAFESDGSVLVAGRPLSNQMVVARIAADGTRDMTFGGNGLASAGFVDSASPNAILVQPNGKVVVAGWTMPSPTSGVFAAARFNGDGTVDDQFGNAGRVSADVLGSSTFEQVMAAAVQPDGKLAFVGTGQGASFIVTRHLGDTPYIDVGDDLDEPDRAISADDPRSFLGAAFAIGTDKDGNPIYAEDGSEIEWRVEGPGGTLDAARTTTKSGFAGNVLHTSRKAGDRYTVYAKITKLVVHGKAIAWNGPEQRIPEVTVRSGVAASITFEVDDASIAADEKSTTPIAIIVKDAAGNFVADGSAVAWELTGTGALVEPTGWTVNGRATAMVRSGWLIESQKVAVTVDGYEASTDVASVKVNVAVTASQTTLVAGSTDMSSITATFTDSEGNPVPDGTPVVWYTQKGTIAGDAVTTDGEAHATVSAIGGSETDGVSYVAAFVANNVGTVQMQFTAPTDRLYVKVNSRVLIGDATADGTVVVEDVEEIQQAYPYFATSTASVRNGPAHGRVRLSLVGNADLSGAPLLKINGEAGSVEIVLDSTGTGTFTLSSTGALSPLIRLAAIGVQAEVVDETGGGGAMMMAAMAAGETASATVAVEQKSFWAKTYDALGKGAVQAKRFGWGALAGETEGATEAVGDITISVIPVIGVYSDGRDVVKNIARLAPGGEDPDWVVTSVAAVGILAEFTVVGDWITDVIKQLAKTVNETGPLFKSVVKMAARAGLSSSFTEINRYRALLVKMQLDPAYAKVADKLVTDDNALKVLNRLSFQLGAESLAGLLKRTATDLGDAAAQQVMTILATVPPTALVKLRDANKLDVVAKGIASGTAAFTGWQKRHVEIYSRLLTDADPAVMAKLDDLAGVRGSHDWLRRAAKEGMTDGIAGEITVAKKLKDEGEVLERVSHKFADGEIDVETATKVLDVKTGNPNNGSLEDLGEQLTRLKKYAESKNKTPLVYMKSTELAKIHPDRQALFDSLNIDIIPFD